MLLEKNIMNITEIDKDNIEMDAFRIRVLTEESDLQMKKWVHNDSWKRIPRDVLALWYEDEIIGISGERKYKNNYVRVGSPQYLFRENRNTHRNSLLKPGGFMQHHVERHGSVFFSVHLYCPRMVANAENFYKRRVKQWGEELLYVDDIRWLGHHMFHGVEQAIFSLYIDDTDHLLDTILAE